MIRRPPRSTQSRSSAASDVYKRQTGVSLTDLWPAGFSQGTITPSQGTCTGTGNFTCALGTIASGGSATVTVAYSVPSSTVGDQTNTVSVSSDVPDPVLTNNSASDTDTVITSANLSVTKSDGVTDVTAGTSVGTYTISVHNTGPSDATGVSLTDLWPAGFSQGTITPSQGTCTGTGNFTCALGTIASGGSATVTVAYSVPSSTVGAQTNTVSVSSDVTDPDLTNNAASDTDTVITKADLSVTKTDGVTSVVAGLSTGTYTISVHNTGPSDATGVSLTDLWSAGFSQGTITPSQGTCTGTGDFTCALGTIASGGSATVTVAYSVPSSTVGDQTNTVSVSSAVGDPDLTNNAASDTDTVITKADLSVTKTDGVTSVTAGLSTGTYTISVHNTGPSDATGVSLTDLWPAGFSQGTITPSQGTCTGTGNFTCALGTIASGGSATVTVAYSVPSSTVGDQTNTVSVTSDVLDPVLTNNAVSDTDTVITSANLSVTKTDGVTSVTAGLSTGTYTISVHNTGPSDATGVSLTDLWPAGFSPGTITPSQGTCTGTGNFTCALGTIASGGSATVTVAYSVPSSTVGDQTNTVSVTSDVLDPVLTNNAVSDTDTVITSANLSVTKTDGVTSVTAGLSTGTYTISVHNTGPSDATGVSLTDLWPAGFSQGTITPSQGTCTGTGNFTCALGTIASGGSATVTVAYSVPSSTVGAQTNTVSVSSDVTDPDLTNNAASDTDTVITSADLSVTKTDGVTSVTAGLSTGTYTISVHNTGPSDATGVSLTDLWPAGFSQGTITPSQGTCTGTGNFTCALGTIASGGSATVTVAYSVPSSTVGDQTNTVSVTSDVLDPVLTNNAVSDTDTVITSANLSVTKTDGVTSVTAGLSTGTYTISVHNTGPSDATGVSLTDLWPAGFSQGTITPSQGTCTGTGDFTCALGTIASG